MKGIFGVLFFGSWRWQIQLLETWTHSHTVHRSQYAQTLAHSMKHSICCEQAKVLKLQELLLTTRCAAILRMCVEQVSSMVIVWLPVGSLGDNEWTIKDGFRPTGDRRYITRSRSTPAWPGPAVPCSILAAAAAGAWRRTDWTAATVGDQSKTDDTPVSWRLCRGACVDRKRKSTFDAARG